MTGIRAILNIGSDVSYCVGNFHQGLDHPECITWGCDGFAYAGGEGGQVYRIDIHNGSFEHFASTGGFVGGLCQDASGNIYACSQGAILKVTPEGMTETYSRTVPSEPLLKNPNYPAFDRVGNLYVTDSGKWKKDNGKIFRFSPGGTGSVWTDQLKTFPNGICMSSDERYLYVALSLNFPRIERIPIKHNGEAGEPELVVALPDCVPDGIAFDTDGNLYISCYRPDRIYKFSSTSKRLDILVEDFEGTLMAAPTNIAFCGSKRDILLSSNLGRWHISRYKWKLSGLPLHYPII